MKRLTVLLMIWVAAVLLAACVAPTPVATVSNIMDQGEEVPFEICGESATWRRPAEGEQKARWWDNGRYAGLDEEVVKYPWTHNFLVAYGNASGEYDLINLSGLWTLPGDVRNKCLEPAVQDDVLKLQTAEVWVLLYRVKRVSHVGTDYYLMVKPVAEGVQFVRFARPEQQVPLTLHFVSEDGQALEKIVEAESPY